MQKGKSQRRGSPTTVMVLAVLAFVAVGGAAAWFVFLRDTPQQAMQRLVAACEAGDTERIRELCSESSLETLGAVSDSLLPNIVPVRTPVPGTKCSARVGKCEISGGEATVTLTVTYASGERSFDSDLPYVFVREGMQWKCEAGKTLEAMFHGAQASAEELGRKMGGR